MSKYVIDPGSGCWNWIGEQYVNGYGRLREGAPSKRYLRAHRVSYEHFKGAIPAGLVVMHRCDNRRCINPEHLSVGTAKDNIQDAIAKGRMIPWAASGAANSKGSANPSARLSEGDALEIRAIYKAGGVSQAELGRRYGVSKNTIQAICCGRSWAAVQP